MTVVKTKLQVFSSHVFATGLVGDGRQYGDGTGLEATAEQSLIRGSLVTAHPLFVLGYPCLASGLGTWPATYPAGIPTVATSRLRTAH